jgi:glutamate racemase
MQQSTSPIGIFDSGYGGLTILSDLKKRLPDYDYLYLGDNARAPYGPRSFDVVYQFTLEAVKFLFDQGCELVILACNTASAKALRTIQQNDLPTLAPNKRVLGVIRPTSEVIGNYSENKHVGILATEGTIKSDSYRLEIAKFFPQLEISQKSCPIWVPLIENQLHEEEGGKWFIRRDIERLFKKDSNIDTLLLGCTHYPLVASIVRDIVGSGVKVLTQGEIVADSLKAYLDRHSSMDNRCSKHGTISYLTTETAEDFDKRASKFLKEPIRSKHVVLHS